jgi:hypothetical protein
MTTGLLAALLGALVLGFEEGLRRFYPARETWRRLRSRHGRRAVRAMRERMEAVAVSRLPRRLAEVLLAIMIVWVASASLLDKRWYEVVADVLPYVLVGVALVRTPSGLAAITLRMRDYEREVGEDPDGPLNGEDGGPEVIAL